jgi:amidophosphoribosyltransferase
MLHFPGQGLVPRVFSQRTLDYLKGPSGIGHVRYFTSEAGTLENASPY